MSYIYDLRAELERRLADMEVTLEEEGVKQYDVLRGAFIKFILETVLESYKNGIRDEAENRRAAKSRMDNGDVKPERAARRRSTAAAE